MHELALVFAVIFVSTSVAVGLVLICGRFLKLRQQLAPEVVYARGESADHVARPESARTEPSSFTTHAVPARHTTQQHLAA